MAQQMIFCVMSSGGGGSYGGRGGSRGGDGASGGGGAGANGNGGASYQPDITSYDYNGPVPPRLALPAPSAPRPRAPKPSPRPDRDPNPDPPRPAGAGYLELFSNLKRVELVLVERLGGASLPAELPSLDWAPHRPQPSAGICMAHFPTKSHSPRDQPEKDPWVPAMWS